MNTLEILSIAALFVSVIGVLIWHLLFELNITKQLLINHQIDILHK